MGIGIGMGAQSRIPPADISVWGVLVFSCFFYFFLFFAGSGKFRGVMFLVFSGFFCFFWF